MTEQDYGRLVEQYRRLLILYADLKIENAKIKKELELYKAFSTDISHELVAQAIEKGEKVCRN